MYLAELREFKTFLVAHTDIQELKSHNLLGVQIALRRDVDFASLNIGLVRRYNGKSAKSTLPWLCEASKYIFFLTYEKGPIYKPASRDFDLVLQTPSSSEAARLKSIWSYWEDTAIEETVDEVPEDYGFQGGGYGAFGSGDVKCG